jgi:dipeptidyl aminopeptidase/acylaminoacyl peptidase
VLFTHSTALFKKLQDLNAPFEIMTYPGSKHGLLRHAETGPHAYMMVKRFFDRTIGDRTIGERTVGDRSAPASVPSARTDGH